MTLTGGQMWAMILAIALGVQIPRWLPFVAFPERRETPAFVLYLGRVLPPALMGFLVVYCFKGAAIRSFPYGLPELLAVAVVIGSYRWKKNMLLSVAAGTALYMSLVQNIPGV